MKCQHTLELSRLTCVVLASVLGPCALESIGHPPNLFFCKDGRCIVDCAVCLKRHFQHFLTAVCGISSIYTALDLEG